jgi:hypothetical protein
MIELFECTLQSRRICVASDIAIFQQEKAMMFIHLPDLLKLLSRLGERQDKVTHQGAVGGAACMIVGPPEGSFYVTCKKASMYGKRMRDVHIAGFTVKSDAVIRFRTRDGKVAVADILMVMGRYSRIDKGTVAMANMIARQDEMVKDLLSIEVDKSLTDMVSTSFPNQNIQKIFCTQPHWGIVTNFYSTIFCWYKNKFDQFQTGQPYYLDVFRRRAQVAQPPRRAPSERRDGAGDGAGDGGHGPRGHGRAHGRWVAGGAGGAVRPECVVVCN